ncbi:MAG: hypothetical protein N2C12_15910, partial [Planctomycetales bacterium]
MTIVLEFAIVTLPAASVVLAEDTPPSGETDRLGESTVRNRLESAKETAGLDELTLQGITDLYKQAFADLQQEADLAETTAAYVQDASAAEEQLTEAKAKLAQALPEEDLGATDKTTLLQLESQLKNRQRTWEVAAEQLQELNAEPGRRQGRRATIPELQEAAK